MQNKANLLDAQMNVTSFITKYYENKWQRRVRKNKANSNPIKAKKSQSKPIKCQNKPNTKPIKANFKGKKMLLSTFLLWDVVRRKLCCLRVYLGNVG